MGSVLQLLDILFEVFLAICALERHDVLLHPKLLEVLLDVADGDFIVSRGRALVSILVVAEVARVQNIVFQRVKVIRQRLDMMRSNEPLFAIILRQVVLDIL